MNAGMPKVRKQGNKVIVGNEYWKSCTIRRRADARAPSCSHMVREELPGAAFACPYRRKRARRLGRIFTGSSSAGMRGWMWHINPIISR